MLRILTWLLCAWACALVVVRARRLLANERPGLLFDVSVGVRNWTSPEAQSIRAEWQTLHLKVVLWTALASLTVAALTPTPIAGFAAILVTFLACRGCFYRSHLRARALQLDAAEDPCFWPDPVLPGPRYRLRVACILIAPAAMLLRLGFGGFPIDPAMVLLMGGTVGAGATGALLERSEPGLRAWGGRTCFLAQRAFWVTNARFYFALSVVGAALFVGVLWVEYGYALPRGAVRNAAGGAIGVLIFGDLVWKLTGCGRWARRETIAEGDVIGAEGSTRHWIGGSVYAKRGEWRLVVERRSRGGFTLNYGWPAAWVIALLGYGWALSVLVLYIMPVLG